MRNLKKFLALVMAMVMAFSLMLTADAASKYDQVKEWNDKDQVDEAFVEAVDVLSGMEIFQGDERGFAPGSTITRAETAALIYRLATGDVEDARAGLYANYGNFADVKEGDWFAGYVGYCANAGYIKGTTPTTFNPYAPVTGYEALAMILRAVGYDKNGEFTGATWQTNVSALGTRLGVLDQVKTTHYGNTLHLASRRDVVASILFEAAQLNTVTYTPALGYETDRFATDGSDSLGVKNFGLKSVTGIIVGNQDTGETMTRINKVATKDNKAVAPEYYAYFHQSKNFNVWTGEVEETTVTTTIDAKTGVEMFGHNVKAWYSTFTGNKTFALYDKVVKTALVTPNPLADNSGDSDAVLSGGTNELGKAVQSAGFSVDLSNSHAVFNKDFGISGARRAFSDGTEDGKDYVYTMASDATVKYVTDYVTDGINAMADTTNNTPANDTGTRDTDGAVSNSMLGSQADTQYPLYLVISNNSALTPDMIIALNVEVSKVVQVNNYATHQTVTVPQVTGSTNDFNADGFAGAAGSNRIAQGALTATSTKTLGDGVVAINIAGTKVTNQTVELNGSGYAKLAGYTQPTSSPLHNTNETSLFRLSKPTQVVEGVVTAYKGSKLDYTNATSGGVSHTGSITINGQVIERSLLADAIVSYDGTAVDSEGAQIKAVGLSAAAQTYQKYRAYLDEEGKYIWVEPITERTFIYGTYIDYQTPYASSSYEYTIVGINEKGEQVKQVVKTFNGDPINSSNYRLIGQFADHGLPYRDNASGVAGVSPNLYGGFTLGSNGDIQTNDIVNLGWHLADENAETAFSGTSTTNTTITSTDVKVGMKQTGAGTGATDSYYITEDTKVIAVSGAGTDTQKVKIYNGITELLDGAISVTIKNATAMTNTSVLSDHQVSTPTTSDNYDYSNMMYYTTSDFTYASNVSRAKQIDTLILPADALSWAGRSNLYFIGNNEKTSEIQVGSNWFTQFVMYKDGERQNVWIEGRDNGAGSQDAGGTNMSSQVIASAGGNDSFYELRDSGKTLPDGTTVYALEGYVAGTAAGSAGTAGTAVSITDYDANGRPDVANSQPPIIWGATYWAATYSAQTAMINGGASKSTSGNTFGITGGSFATGMSQAGEASYNVAGAKVVNLNAPDSPYGTNLSTNNINTGYIWNGISDLGTLNDAASTSVIFANNRQPVVSCQVNPANPLQVTVIYVHWSQDVALDT